jgi:hypothetical protein
MREGPDVQLEDRRNGGGGAERADRSGGVPEAVMRRLHRKPDTRRDFVADDDRAQERFAVPAARLGGGERGADHRATRVIDGVTEDVVELDRMRGGGVDQRGRAKARTPAARIDDRAVGPDLVGERAGKQRRRRQLGTRKKRCEPIDQRAPGVVPNGIGKRT